MRFLKFFAIFMIGMLMEGCSQKNSHNTPEVATINLPIHQETTALPLKVEGKIPDWLEGDFVRNGPVSLQINNQNQAHWFDGLAMLHSFSFQHGNISYSNKFLKTDPYNTVFMKGNFNFLGFDSITPHPIWDGIKSFFSFNRCHPLQNANVNVAKIANHYVALTEIPLPVRFNIQNMDTLGTLEYQDKLPKGNIFDSAHPKVDGKTQEQFNYIVDYGFKTDYIIYRYHPDTPCREIVGKIPVKKPAYMHSFALTENYVVLVEYPLVVRPINIMFLTRPFIQNYYWEPNRGTNFIIINRRTGQVTKEIRDCNPIFAFHHVNAYEEQDKIILDIVAYKDASVISDISQHGYLSNHVYADEKVARSKLLRYTLSLNDAMLQSEIILDGSLELPRINEKYMAYKHRYIYASDQRLLSGADNLRPIYKIDAQTKALKTWQEVGVLPGEPVFIARPGAKEEDDGVVVNIMLNVSKQQAFLLILDGKTFTEIARCYAPYAIPIGLHGQFF